MVQSIEHCLQTEWHGDRIVWAGDYIDDRVIASEYLPDESDLPTLYEYAEDNFEGIALPTLDIALGMYLLTIVNGSNLILQNVMKATVRRYIHCLFSPALGTDAEVIGR